jgi:hypothetical protein
MPWDLNGNAGTNAGNNYLGTTDDQPLVIRTNGKEQLRVSSTGNVGIGSTETNATLEVTGHTYVNNISNAGPINQLSLNERGVNWGHFYGDSTNRVYFGASTALNTVPASPIMTWDLATDQVGLGNPRPNARLDVQGNVIVGTDGVPGDVWVGGSVKLGGSTGTGELIGSSRNDTKANKWGLDFFTDYIPRLSITHDGNVGIGTQTPSQALEVRGSVAVSGDILLENADFAEDFEIAGTEVIDPGSVVILESSGLIQESSSPYDTRVAGVVSGAGGLRPAIRLNHQHDAPSGRLPVALLGRVACKVDADAAPVVVGDLLTTSDRPGHAMRVQDCERGLGAILGKALAPLASGRGVIPVLVAPH